MRPSTTRTQSVTTSWADLPDVRGSEVSILNRTGAALEIRHGGDTDAGEQITISDGQSVALKVAANASEIEIKASAGAAGVQIVVN